MPSVAYVLSDAGYGGTEVHLRDLVRRLDRDFRPVALLAGAGPERVLAPELAALGADVERLPTLFHAHRGGLPLVRALRRHRPDIVHVHMTNPVGFTKAFLAARLARVPVLLSTEHGHAHHLRSIDGLNGRRLRMQARARIAMEDRVIVVADAQARTFEDVLATPRTKMTVVPNGIETCAFATADGAAVRAELGIPKHAPVAGMVTSFFEYERAGDFVRAAGDVVARVPDTHFVIVGDRHPVTDAAADEVRRRVVALVRERGLGGRVHLVGFREDVPAVLAALDVFVLPARSKVFGLVIVEAMAAGKPVVATAGGGVPEIVVDGQTGILVPPLEPTRLAEALDVLLGDGALRARMGRAGRCRAESHFSATTMASRTMEVYRELLARRGVAA